MVYSFVFDGNLHDPIPTSPSISSGLWAKLLICDQNKQLVNSADCDASHNWIEPANAILTPFIEIAFEIHVITRIRQRPIITHYRVATTDSRRCVRALLISVWLVCFFRIEAMTRCDLVRRDSTSDTHHLNPYGPNQNTLSIGHFRDKRTKHHHLRYNQSKSWYFFCPIAKSRKQ